jgi:outer membrane murein-binding lipoprotein Lpp
MKDALVIALSASLAGVVTLSLFLVSAVQSQRAIRTQNEQLAARVKALEQQVAALCEVTNALARDIQTARQAKPAPEPPPAKAEPEQAPVDQAGPKVAPYQVPVYVGQKQVGLGWVVPTQVKRDVKTGRVTYQPVIRLPESVQSALTMYVTNVVERPLPRPAPAVPEPGYYHYYHYHWRQPWWWPGYAVAVHVGPEPRPSPPPSNPAVPHVSVGGPWTPVAVVSPPPARPSILAPPSPGSPGIFVPPGLR